MEAGRPIVSTAVGGVPDLIEDGVHGRLVAPRDPGALAGAISDLLRNPAEGAALGARARERRQHEFTMQAMVQRFEALYLQLLDDDREGDEPTAGDRSPGPSPGPAADTNSDGTRVS